MIRITEKSYYDLKSQGSLVWSEDDKFFCQEDFLEESHKPFVEELPKYFIYNFLDRPVGGLSAYDKPASIIFPDQLNTNLYKEHKLLYGEKIETIYYAAFDISTKELKDPVVKIAYVYNRDSDYLLEYKNRTISWIFESGVWSEDTQEDVIPYLSNAKKLAEIRILRTNIVDEAESLAKDLGLFEVVQELFFNYLDEITLYKEAGSPLFSQMILEDSENSYWLDEDTRDGKMTIRQFLAGFFLIGTKTPDPE